MPAVRIFAHLDETFHLVVFHIRERAGRNIDERVPPSGRGDGHFIGEFVPEGYGGLDAPTFLTFVPEPGGAMLMLIAACVWAKRRRA